MTDTLELVRSLTDAEWNHLAGRLLTGPFPTARPDQRRPPDGDWDVARPRRPRLGQDPHRQRRPVEHARAGGDRFAAGPTYADARDVMTEGPTGLLACCAAGASPTRNRSSASSSARDGASRSAPRTSPSGGVAGTSVEAGPTSPVRGGASTRGPRSVSLPASATTPASSSPARPGPPLVMDLAQRTDGTVHVTRGRMLDNVANLSPAFVAEMERRYAGTRIGRQEPRRRAAPRHPGALWNLAQFEAPASGWASRRCLTWCGW